MSELMPSRGLVEPPEDPQGLFDFPTRVYAGGSEVWRVHQAALGPWYFGSSGRYRFDLTDAGRQRGTCYVALDPVTALLEIIDTEGGMVNIEYLDARRIRMLSLPRDVRMADTRSRRAAGYGVTREIGAEFPYGRTQRWATAFDLAQFNGIAYWPNHDLGTDAAALALFGKAGERRSSPWRRGSPERIEGGWLVLLERESGIEVQRDGTPPSSELTIE